MMFGIIKCDLRVFTGDKLFIDVSKSFVPTGTLFHATVSHEISMDAGATWINVTALKNISWIFSTAGSKTITLRLTDSLDNQETFTLDVTCLDLTTQNLFSNDSDLYGYETEIDQYLPKKWSSWNLVHLKAQEWIIDWLDEMGYKDMNGNSYVVADLLQSQQVKQLSCVKTLELIYESNINIPDDLFTKKRDKYKAMVSEKASRSYLQLDFNKNGTTENIDRQSLNVVRLVRG
jgi:uncharacterized protein YktA (UPF0223 family)